jgi:DNA-binding transcriptional LysR family regulator
VPMAGINPIALVQLFAKHHPKLRFQLFALSSEQILEQLTSNQLDLGLSYIERLTSEHFKSRPLAQTGMGLLHDTRYFHFDSPTLTWEQVAELPLGLLSAGMHFRQSIEHCLRQRGLKPEPRLETDAVYQLLQAVSAGLCCGVVPCDSAFEQHGADMRLTPIEDAQTLAPLGLIMRRGNPTSPLAEACFREAQAVFTELAQNAELA